MIRRIFISFLIIFVGTLFIQTKAISYSSNPEVFISEVIEEAKIILSGSSSAEEKANKLSEIALKTVDIKGIGYYTLGSKRKELTSDELKKYETIFQKYFLKSIFQIDSHIFLIHQG